MKPHRGTLILILGILGLTLCGIFTAIPAWIMGSTDMKEIEAGAMDPAGRGMTQAGKILGIIGVALTVVGFGIAILLAIVGGMAGAGRQ